MQGWSFSLSEYIIPRPSASTGGEPVDEDPVAPAAATASLPFIWTLLGIPAGKWDKYGLELEEQEEDNSSSDESIDAALDHAEYYADY